MTLKSSKYLNLTVYNNALVYDTSLVKNYKTKAVEIIGQVVADHFDPLAPEFF